MKILKTISIATALILSTSANAALVERLGGLAYYDTEADLTWLTDANYAGTTDYAPYNGLMSWSDANTWAENLNINGITGWRLPETLIPDETCSYSDWGPNCTGSEMGNMFYNVLGGVANNSISTIHNTNYDLFSNIQPTSYWSATEYMVEIGTDNVLTAWLFNFDIEGVSGAGYQNSQHIGALLSAWAVYDGDISAVPVPAAVWLFGSGLIGLVGFARHKKA